MSELARTHLRQARGLLKSGEATRALELLEKARLLARGDRALLGEVLLELETAALATGNTEISTRARAHREALDPASSGRNHEPPVVANRGPESSGSKIIWIVGSIVALVVLLVLGGLGFTAWWTIARAQVPTIAVRTAESPSMRGAGPAHAPSVAATPVAATAPDTQPVAGVPATQSREAGVEWDRQRLLKDNVGMVVVIARYEGMDAGRRLRVELPAGVGTAFAVSTEGVLLTNRHVVDAAKPTAQGGGAPATLDFLGAPTLTLRGTSYRACFGASASEHYDASLLHSSRKFDLAVLKIDRRFARPLVLSTKRVRVADDVLVCGYPGAVVDALNQANSTKVKLTKVKQQWRTSGTLSLVDVFAPDAFDSTVTRGIVSAPERHIRSASYVQIDAAISAGSSGGPVLNAGSNEVIGLATFGIRGEGVGNANYNFALAVDQLQEEIEPHLKGNPNP